MTLCLSRTLRFCHGDPSNKMDRVFMLVLFVVELFAFLSTTTETNVILDTNADTQLRINFNITLMDLACDYAAVDVYDVLGTNTQVSQSVQPP